MLLRRLLMVICDGVLPLLKKKLENVTTMVKVRHSEVTWEELAYNGMSIMGSNCVRYPTRIIELPLRKRFLSQGNAS